MKKSMTDQKLTQILRQLGNESPVDRAWNDRVWAKIEADVVPGKVFQELKQEIPADPGWGEKVWAKIEAEIGKEEPVPSFSPSRSSVLRWTTAAACLMIALGLSLQRQRSAEVDLGAYVSDLYAQNASILEAESDDEEPLLLSDGTGITPVGVEDSDALPTVYDTLLEM